jgi:DNA-binding MarR family transcriptional regulator
MVGGSRGTTYCPAVTPRSRIQDEIQQTRPFRSRTVEAGAAVLRTADTLRRYLEAVLEPYGVTWQQYNVMRILRGAGPDGLPTLAIGERMIEQTPGISRLVDRLVAKGLVARTRGTRDLRQVICHLTPTGRDLLARLDAPTDAADDFMFSGLSHAQLGTLVTLLDEVRAVIAAGLATALAGSGAAAAPSPAARRNADAS